MQREAPLVGIQHDGIVRADAEKLVAVVDEQFGKDEGRNVATCLHVVARGDVSPLLGTDEDAAVGENQGMLLREMALLVPELPRIGDGKVLVRHEIHHPVDTHHEDAAVVLQGHCNAGIGGDGRIACVEMPESRRGACQAVLMDHVDAIVFRGNEDVALAVSYDSHGGIVAQGSLPSPVPRKAEERSGTDIVVADTPDHQTAVGGTDHEAVMGKSQSPDACCLMAESPLLGEVYARRMLCLRRDDALQAATERGKPQTAMGILCHVVDNVASKAVGLDSVDGVGAIGIETEPVESSGLAAYPYVTVAHLRNAVGRLAERRLLLVYDAVASEKSEERVPGVVYAYAPVLLGGKPPAVAVVGEECPGLHILSAADDGGWVVYGGGLGNAVSHHAPCVALTVVQAAVLPGRLDGRDAAEFIGSGVEKELPIVGGADYVAVLVGPYLPYDA